MSSELSLFMYQLVFRVQSVDLEKLKQHIPKGPRKLFGVIECSSYLGYKKDLVRVQGKFKNSFE